MQDTGSDHLNPHKETLNPSTHSTVSSRDENKMFVSVLTDALDSEVQDTLPKMGFRERRLLGSLCALNGIASASSASKALSSVFTSIIENKKNEYEGIEDASKSGELVILKFASDGKLNFSFSFVIYNY